MTRDVQIDTIKQKILQIEKNIEEENGRAKLNRMPARYFMFFFLIGGEEDSLTILERKVKELLSNPDACEFLQITEKESSKGYGKKVEEILQSAANNRIDVQDLNSVFLCPVIFANNNIGNDVLPILHEIDSYMNQSGHMATWQPTIIINKNISEYKSIYSSVLGMKDFISDMPEGKVNRCCILSNLDENGFAVPKENIMQTIAMTVVLQNVVTKTAGDSQTIRSKVSRSSTTEDGGRLFFTARNAAVTNPTRSLLLQRICSAVDFFSKKADSNNAITRINYSFVSQIMNKYITSLPLHAGKVSLFPLYSVISDNLLHSRLERIIKEKYYDPLCGEEIRRTQVETAKAMFLENYFSENGSLAELKKLILENALERELLKHKMECYDNKQIEAPSVEKSKLIQFQSGDYQQARIYCENLIKNSGWDLLETVGKELSQPDTLYSIDNAQEYLELIKSCIQSRLRQLKDVETVLVVDQTEQRTNFGEVQNDWLESTVLNNPKEYASFNKKFNETIYSLLQDKMSDYSKILEICYDAIKHSAYSNNDYMNRVGEECMVNEERAYEFSAVVEKSWCYTLRFLSLDETKDATCIIGDSKNCFCRNLCEKFKGSLFDFSGFDRIDVLHISGAFSPENILEWEQIEAIGKGE